MAVFRGKFTDISKLLNKALIDPLEEGIEGAERQFKKDGALLLKEEILDSVARGVSPVKGGGNQTGGKPRFQKYSDVYRKRIRAGKYGKYNKKVRPVNLKLSGKMLNSIKTRPTKDGFSLWFSDEKAKWHNDEGAGLSKVKRKMLPTEPGEEFSRVIIENLVKKFEELLDLE